MTSPSKIKSNRANARFSTGPKSTEGKSRASRSALRHGLSRSVLSDPIFSEEVEALAREIAGRDASPEIQELARQIAEAQIDLRRVHYARHGLLSNALVDSASDLLDPTLLEGPVLFATILSDMAQRLAAMDRYERRALSRRKFAIRAFDAARGRAVAGVRPNASHLD